MSHGGPHCKRRARGPNSLQSTDMCAPSGRAGMRSRQRPPTHIGHQHKAPRRGPKRPGPSRHVAAGTLQADTPNCSERQRTRSEWSRMGTVQNARERGWTPANAVRARRGLRTRRETPANASHTVANGSSTPGSRSAAYGHGGSKVAQPFTTLTNAFGMVMNRTVRNARERGRNLVNTHSKFA
jgi:hypothetical protein